MAGSDGDIPWSANDERPGWRAVETLYRDHADWLRALVTRRLRAQPADVDDIVQDTWIRAAGHETDDPEMPEIDLVVGEPRPWTPGPSLSNSFGFGGHNGCHIIGPG